MIMNDGGSSIRDAAMVNLGRSNKKIPVDAKTNPRGRYALHFHRCKWENSEVEGCVVEGGVGWGIVNHSSNVWCSRCIGFNNLGAHFVSEAGDECGDFVDCHALVSEGSGEGTGTASMDNRAHAHAGTAEQQDGGHLGHGFWIMSPLIGLRNCYAFMTSSFGFVYWTPGLRETDTGKERALIESKFLPDELKYLAQGEEYVKPSHVPVLHFTDCTAEDCGYGLGFGLNGSVPKSIERFDSHIKDFKVINPLGYLGENTVYSHPVGIHLRYGEGVVFENLHIESTEDENYTVGVEPNNDWFDAHYIDSKFSNLFKGVIACPRGQTSAKKSDFYYCLSNVVVPTSKYSKSGARWSTRSVKILDSAKQPGSSYMTFERDYPKNHKEVPGIFEFNEFSLDGHQVWMDDQKPDAIPFMEYDSVLEGGAIPNEFVGLTTQQIFDRYGLKIGGLMYGERYAGQKNLIIQSGNKAKTDVSYLLKVKSQETKDTWEDSAWTFMNPGWNLLTRDIFGKKTTVLVWGEQ
jgi:hypothetical protein